MDATLCDKSRDRPQQFRKSRNNSLHAVVSAVTQPSNRRLDLFGQHRLPDLCGCCCPKSTTCHQTPLRGARRATYFDGIVNERGLQKRRSPGRWRHRPVRIVPDRRPISIARSRLCLVQTMRQSGSTGSPPSHRDPAAPRPATYLRSKIFHERASPWHHHVRGHRPYGDQPAPGALDRGDSRAGRGRAAGRQPAHS